MKNVEVGSLWFKKDRWRTLDNDYFKILQSDDVIVIEPLLTDYSVLKFRWDKNDFIKMFKLYMSADEYAIKDIIE